MPKPSVPDPNRDMVPELADSREALRASRESLASVCMELERARELATCRTKRGRATLELQHEALKVRK